MQLLGGVFCGLGRALGVLDLACGGGVFGEDGTGQARDLVGDQGQARPAFVHALLEVGLGCGQRVGEEGAVEGDIDDLLAQLFCRAERHVGDGHFLQIGHVLFKVLQRIPDLQRKQAAQAGAVPGGGDLGFIEHFNRHRIARVDQRRKADQRLALAADFHQLGQFAKVPGRVARVARGRFVFYSFDSCSRLSLKRWRRFLI